MKKMDDEGWIRQIVQGALIVLIIVTCIAAIIAIVQRPYTYIGEEQDQEQPTTQQTTTPTNNQPTNNWQSPLRELLDTVAPFAAVGIIIGLIVGIIVFSLDGLFDL